MAASKPTISPRPNAALRCSDFLTLAAPLWLFHFGQSAFQTGCFLESLATHVLVLFVIRTIGRPRFNRPSLALITTTLAVLIAGVVLPYSPVARLLGMVPLPAAYLVFLGLVVPGYLLLVELLKRRLLRSILTTQFGQDRPLQGAGRGVAVPRLDPMGARREDWLCAAQARAASAEFFACFPPGFSPFRRCAPRPDDTTLIWDCRTVVTRRKSARAMRRRSTTMRSPQKSQPQTTPRWV